MSADIISLDDYRQELAERACGVGKYSGARLVDGKVVVSTSLDDEAMVLKPAAARTLALMLLHLADVADGGDRG